MPRPGSLKGVNLTVEVDEDYIKAVVTKNLLSTAFNLYHQAWTILTNDTSHEFLTSDNPSAVFPPPTSGGPVVRILPLSPQLSISTIMEPNPVHRKDFTEADLKMPPKGWITYKRAAPNGVKLANRLTVVNAERFVFSRVASSGVAVLVKKYGDYSAKLEHSAKPTPSGGVATQAHIFVENSGIYSLIAFGALCSAARRVGQVSTRKVQGCKTAQKFTVIVWSSPLNRVKYKTS